jgi:peptide/nickel transport system substrate-binding protein
MIRNIFWFAILISGIGFIGCGGSQQKSDVQNGNHPTFIEFPDAKKMLPGWSKENTLIFQVSSDPVNLHPANVVNLTAFTIQKMLQGYLVMVDLKNVSIVPGIIKAMPLVSDDQLEYTYELLDEVTWDDGTPVTAEDVIFTMKAHKCKLTNDPQVKPSIQNLKSVKADPANPKKFVIEMMDLYIQNKSFLSDIPILSRKFFDPENVWDQYTFDQLNDPAFKADTIDALNKWSIEFNDGKYGNDPANFFGIGPYKITAWDRESTVTLEKKKNHWTENLRSGYIGLNSFPEKIIVKIEKDETALLLDFKSQAIDVSAALPTKVLIDLQQDSIFNRNYNSAFVQSYSANFIVMNMKPDGVSHKKIFDDLKVRRALAMLTPVDQIIEVLVMGKGIRWPSIVSPLMPEFNSDLKLVQLDVEGAKKLLNEAGWNDVDGDGTLEKVVDGENIPLQVEFTFGVQGNLSANLVNMIVESAAKAGVKIIPKGVEIGVLQQNLSQHNFDMAIAGWTGGAFIKDYTQLWSTQSWSSNGSNFSGFGDASSDALLDSMKHTMNDSVRNQMSKRFQKVIYDQQPYIFMYSTYRKVAMHKRWGNQIATAESPSLIINNFKLISATGSTSMLLTNGEK